MLVHGIVCGALMGCTAFMAEEPAPAPEIVKVEQHVPPPPKVDEDDQCPPIPQIPDNATRYEGRLFTLTLIALYEQCARSKK